MRIFALSLVASALLCGAVPAHLPKKFHRGHHLLQTEAAAADLITSLPGAPKDISFKQYAGIRHVFLVLTTVTCRIC